VNIRFEAAADAIHADLRATEPCFHATALGADRYFGRDEMVALIEPLTPPA
jgi:hypothetical protein